MRRDESGSPRPRGGCGLEETAAASPAEPTTSCRLSRRASLLQGRPSKRQSSSVRPGAHLDLRGLLPHGQVSLVLLKKGLACTTRVASRELDPSGEGNTRRGACRAESH